MATNPSIIPVPFTIEDEEEQLEYAILQSLGHTGMDYSIDPWMRRNNATEHENDAPLRTECAVGSSTRSMTAAAKPISVMPAYCRSKTDPNVSEYITI